MQTIDAALAGVAAGLGIRSGAVFYSGPSAFTGPKSLYLLGLNPGGDPLAQSGETVARHIDQFHRRTADWSAYVDDSWRGAAPGTWGMQPRVRHLLDRIGFDPRAVPASNVVFVRSRTEADLAADKDALIAQCWPVHRAVIATLRIRTIVCFGGTAGRWVRDQLGANQLIDKFQETNARGWTSDAHIATDGRAVLTLTHPGRANWCNPAADPSDLVRRVCERTA